MTVVISQSDSYANLIVKGLDLLKNQSQWQFPAEPVLLIIDIHSPVGHPWSLDCGSLLRLVDYLQKNGVGKIYVFPSLHFNFKMNKVMENLGLTPFLETKGLQLWNPWKKLEVVQNEDKMAVTDHPTIEQSKEEEHIDFGSIIVYTQLRTMGDDSLWSTLTQLYSLYTYYSEYSKIRASNPANYQGDPSGDMLWDWLAKLFKNENKDESIDLPLNFPLLIINDGFQVVNSESQYFWDEIQVQEPHLGFIGTDLREVEQIAFQYLTINQDTAWYYKNHPNFRVTNSLTPLISSNMDSITPFVLNFSSRTDPYTNKHFQTLLGQLDDSEEFQSYVFIPLLRGILYDDFPNHDHITILMGNTPPDPPIQKTIIIYGDSTLETTKDARFQIQNTHELEKEPFEIMGKNFGGSKMLPDEALEREILRKQRKFRQKIEKLSQKFEDFKISLEEKEILEERDYLILVKNKKFQLMVQNIRMKIELLQTNMQTQNSLLKIKLSAPKLVENTNIVRIPTDRSLGWDFLVDLIYQWKPKKSPALYNFYRNCETVYNFPAVSKQWHQSQNEHIKTFIQSEMKERSTPMQPGMEKKVQEIKEHQKKAILRIKTEFKVAKSKIIAECDPLLAELSAKIHQLKKENLKLKQKARKVKMHACWKRIRNFGKKFLRSRSPVGNSTQDLEPTPSPSSPPDDAIPIKPLKEDP